MEWLYLPIFPEGALAHSVTTCVWVGVFIVVLFNLRLGWVLSGLVVPGYLAPLVFVKPWAAGVVVFEATVTYLLVYLFSERGSKVAFYNGLFGRDRFFALVLVSIIVRLVFDTWLLPDAASWLEQRFDLAVDFRNNLHSFGLIIICLLANQFWKTGLLRGLVPVAVPIVLTCLVIRLVLMEFTNFSVGNLNYIYEDVAASLLASPKAYMILILAAFIASRMNLHYGWDYNGILIPALLALQWYQPEKILISFFEAGVILLVAQGLLRLPVLSHVNIEGGRKLLLFFNIGYAYKLLLGWSVLWLDRDVNVTDYYGFGYLLPTLIAIKMHDKEIVARLSRATLQTSLVAVLIASVLAFALSRIDWQSPATRFAAAAANTAGVRRTWKSLTEALQDETLTAYTHRSVRNVNKPLAKEIDQFNRALKTLLRYRSGRADGAGDGLILEAAGRLATINFEVVEQPDWILIRERQPSFGWGTFVLAKGDYKDLAVEIPAPLEDGHLSHIGAHFFELYGAASLAIAGNQIRLNQSRDPIGTLDQTSLFQAFHRLTMHGDVLQLRGLAALERTDDDAGVAGSVSELRLDGRIPAELDLAALESLVGGFSTFFEPPRAANIQREAAAAGFAELYLSAGAVRQVMYAALTANHDQPLRPAALISDQFLAEWLGSAREVIAPKGSNAYRNLSEAELLYFDEQILAPMLGWIARHGRALECAASMATEGLTEVVPANPANDADACRHRMRNALEDLAGIHNTASVVRHRVGLLRGDADDMLLYLAPLPEPPVRHSAFVVLRVSAGNSLIVQAPRPVAEPGSLEFAVHLFNETRARALIVSGTHGAANTDGSANVLRLVNKSSLFNLASQRLVRDAGDRPLTLVQTRGLGRLGGAAAERADVLVSRRFVPAGEARLAEPLIEAYLERSGLGSRPVDGSFDTMGFENHMVLQNRYLEQAENKAFLTLWVAAEARALHRQQSSNRQLLAQLTSLGLPLTEASLAERLLQFDGERSIETDVEAQLALYRSSADVTVLADLLARQPTLHFEALLDRPTQQIYLLIGEGADDLAGAFLLGPDARSPRRVAQTAAQTGASRGSGADGADGADGAGNAGARSGGPS